MITMVATVMQVVQQLLQLVVAAMKFYGLQEMTFDWYCTGSPGSANLISVQTNSPADLSGYAGTWVAGTGAYPLGDGLCPGDADFASDLLFAFDNYTTVYHWDTEGDDIYTPGVGYHDDEAFIMVLKTQMV